MNYTAKRLPAAVQVQTPGAAAELERKREERMTELALSGWQPSTGWLTDLRRFRRRSVSAFPGKRV